MYRVIFAQQSQRDLRKLRRDLARRASAEIARRYVEALLDFCDSLGQSPFRGEERAHLAPGLRSIGFHGRVAVWFRLSPEQEAVVIARIMYAGRMS